MDLCFQDTGRDLASRTAAAPRWRAQTRSSHSQASQSINRNLSLPRNEPPLPTIDDGMTGGQATLVRHRNASARRRLLEIASAIDGMGRGGATKHLHGRKNASEMPLQRGDSTRMIERRIKASLYLPCSHGSRECCLRQARSMVSLCNFMFVWSIDPKIPGPVFRTDDLMQVFRNAVIPSSTGIGQRPRSPPIPPRQGKTHVAIHRHCS